VTVPRVAIAAALFTVLAMFSVCAFVLHQARLDALARADDASRNTLLVIERDISRNIELYDLSLQGVLEGLRRPLVMALPPNLMRGYLFDRAATAQYLDAIYVLDANGNPVIDSRSDHPVHVNLADRDYFTVHRDHPEIGLYIGRPYYSKVRNGDPSIALTRRIDNPDGSFGGVVLLAVRLEYFQHLFSGLSLGARGSMALIREDGTLIMRMPYNATMIGRDLRGTGPYTKISHLPDATFVDIASIDGIRCHYYVKHIAGLPLIIEVAAADMDIYAGWRRRAESISAAMGLFGAAFIALSVLFVRTLTRNAKAEAELMMLARTDSLTGLHNRRTLDETLEREWRRAKRSGRPLSILFVDLDHFKRYNDRYGHQAGDDALATVATCIAQHARRPADSAARYGGEEFVVVLPETSSVSAASIAETIRRALGSLNMGPRAGERRLTVSIGVATWQTKSGNTVADVIKAADQALYDAKAAGRNRVFGITLA
jgi:diguanylate cyclase (GGDEF)-like protein